MADNLELMSDEAMQEFIRKGFVSFQADMPAGFHHSLYERTAELMEEAGNPGNNIVPVLPELQQVLDHPKVAGTLTSVLGAGYHEHAHRYCHRRELGAERGYPAHKDGDSRHHHRTRWCMAFYYPQDTTLELGPTSVVPGSHYYNQEPDSEVGDEMPVCGAGGTVTIVHYDLWHRRTEKPGDGHRFMYKFLFARMEEPTSPTWDSNDLSWPEADDRRNLMWRAMWEWSAGRSDNGPQSADDGDVGELLGRLEDANETTSFQAAYSLATMGEQAVPQLITRLSSDSEDVRRNAGYGLSSAGQAAVPALEEAAGAERAETRAAAVDALAHMGHPAAPATGTLQAALKDEDDDVRKYASYALCNVGDAAATAVPSLIDALDDSEVWVVRNSSLALARLGAKAAEAVPALARNLHHENRYVQGKAVLALRRIGTREATDVLIEHLTTARWCPLTSSKSQY